MGHDGALEGAGALTPHAPPMFCKSIPVSPHSDASPDAAPAQSAQSIGKPSALMLPIPSSGRERERKKGPPQFLTPEAESAESPYSAAPLLLNQISRSPRRGNLPDVIGRALSPDHNTTPTPGATAGDRTNRTYGGGGTSTAASASYYPSPSPESAGSEEGRISSLENKFMFHVTSYRMFYTCFHMFKLLFWFLVLEATINVESVHNV